MEKWEILPLKRIFENQVFDVMHHFKVLEMSILVVTNDEIVAYVTGHCFKKVLATNTFEIKNN